MPRRLRIHLPGGVYHVTLRGNHQQPVFFADGDRSLLDNIVARSLEKYDSRLHGYCWMTNHIHLLVQIGQQPLGKLIGQIASEFARSMQLKLQASGHFFERRHHAVLVDTDSYLLEVLRYIHMNPVEALIVRDPSDYGWSSHHNYVGRRTEPWLTTDFVLGALANERGAAVAAYRRFISESAEASSYPAMVNADYAILGSDEFIRRVTASARKERSRTTLEALIDEACRRFEVEIGALRSPLRNRYLVKVRAWIAYQATSRAIATTSAVARQLGRTEGALRYAIRCYPEDVK